MSFGGTTVQPGTVPRDRYRRMVPQAGAIKPARPLDLAKLLGPEWRSLEWRLDHLYYIVDKDGHDVPFRLNPQQRAFVRNMHTRNVVIKARQLGFSTLIQLLQLDQAIFRRNHAGVTISDTLPNAGKLFAKIEHALARMPEALAQAMPVKARSARTMLEWEHGSSIYVSTSSRGGTAQLLHVSELGIIGRKYPERAKEIVTGAFESVPVDETIIVESTTEGAAGALYDLAWPAYQRQLAGEPETALDWRVHFYPWFEAPEYVLSDEDTAGVVLGESLTNYFRKLEANLGVRLTPNQKAWYAKKRETLGAAMLREYPASVEEAFEAAVEGAIFGIEMAMVRERGRITDVPLDPEHPVHTFWDFGLGHAMAVWCMQRVGLQNRWVHFFNGVGAGVGLGTFWRELEAWRLATGEFSWGTHHLPHDADAEILGESVTTKHRILSAAGMRNEVVVPRVGDKHTAIDLVRQKLAVDNWFDRKGCADGIKALDNYQWEWSDKIAGWGNQPLHNWASHPTDAWMQYAQGFREFGSGEVRSLREFKNRPRRGI